MSKEIVLVNDLPIGSDSSQPDSGKVILGYKEISSEWAKIIREISLSGNSFTFSVEGPWGVGKSSILNLIYNEIKDGEKNSSGKEKEIKVAKFNPWYFSDSSSTILELIKIVSQGTPIERKEGLAKAFQNLARVSLRTLPSLIPGSNGVADYFDGLIKDKTIEESLVEIHDYLEKNKLHRIIFIDDIDRLNGESCIALFKTVSLLGRLPGVVFVLSLDRGRLGNLVDDLDDYLEKIIQFRFEVPKSSDDEMMDYFFNSLMNVVHEELTERNPEALENFCKESKYLYYLDDSFRLIISTMRQVKRFINFVRISLIRDGEKDLNVIDLIIICAIHFKYGSKHDQDILGYISGAGYGHLERLGGFLDLLSSDERENSKSRLVNFKSGGAYFAKNNIEVSLKESVPEGDVSDFKGFDGVKTYSDVLKLIDVIETKYFSPENLRGNLIKFATQIYKLSAENDSFMLPKRHKERLDSWLEACFSEALLYRREIFDEPVEFIPYLNQFYISFFANSNMNVHENFLQYFVDNLSDLYDENLKILEKFFVHEKCYLITDELKNAFLFLWWFEKSYAGDFYRSCRNLSEEGTKFRAFLEEMQGDYRGYSSELIAAFFIWCGGEGGKCLEAKEAVSLIESIDYDGIDLGGPLLPEMFLELDEAGQKIFFESAGRSLEKTISDVRRFYCKYN